MSIDPKLQTYVDRWNCLADKLIKDRYLDPPLLIELTSCGMLIAIAQRLGDCAGDVLCADKLEQSKRAIANMREDLAMGRAHEVPAASRWN